MELPKEKLNAEPAQYSDFYHRFLDEAKARILKTRVNVARAACKEQMELYFWLGQKILEYQEQHLWGKSAIESFSKDLLKSFPHSKFGFSPRNLWDMRRFYIEYHQHPKLRQLVAEIPWGHNLIIMSRIKDPKAREYYLILVRDIALTRDGLLLNIKSQSYEQHLLAKKQNNFQQTLPSSLAEKANQAFKDIYLFETLGLTKPVVELEMESRMIQKIKEIILELGYGFAFIGNQYRLVSPSGSETFIDLLFYHRRLQALVAIELKAGKFEPEYAGRMNYQLNLLDDLVKEPWENPSIGIILCSERNRIDVEYALRGLDKPVGVSKYELTKSLPKDLAGKLPDPKTLEQQIKFELGDEELQASNEI